MRVLKVFIVLGLWPALLFGNDGFSRTDAFEHTNLVPNSVVANSSYSYLTLICDARDVFGGTFGTQRPSGEALPGDTYGDFIFSDSIIPASLTDYIEFQTKEAVRLEGYRLGLERDYIYTDHQCVRVRLLAKVDGNSEYSLLDEFVPEYSPTINPPAFRGTRAIVTRTITPKVVQSFRVEFFRDPNRQSGVRVNELDAITTFNPEKPKVMITNVPAKGLVAGSNEEINFKATASDPQGIDHMEIYLDGVLVASEPKIDQFLWKNPPAGMRSLLVRAIDKMGGAGEAVVEFESVDELVPVQLSTPRRAGGLIHFEIAGPTQGRKHIIFSSPDGNNWTAVKTNRYPSASWIFSENDRGLLYQGESRPNFKD